MMTESRSHNRTVALLAFAAAVGALAALAVLGAFSRSASAFELPPVAKKMRAFTAPPLQQATVPPNLRTGLDRLSDPQSTGSAILTEVRLLRDNVGVNRVGVFAVPTTGGAVCLLVNERTYVATCAPEFSRRQGNLVIALYSGEGVPFTVAGLASDEVKSVAVEVNGHAQQSTLENNVFFWQSESESVTRESLNAIRAEQVDGSMITVDTP